MASEVGAELQEVAVAPPGPFPQQLRQARSGTQLAKQALSSSLCQPSARHQLSQPGLPPCPRCWGWGCPPRESYSFPLVFSFPSQSRGMQEARCCWEVPAPGLGQIHHFR